MHRNVTVRLSSRRRPSNLDPAAAFISQVQDVRLQLTEQFKCLDQKLETQSAIIMELQEFFRRKAEVEVEYSKNLDKLAKQFQLRHKTEKQKRETWMVFSTFGCWQQLVNITKKESRDHGLMGELYGVTMATKLGEIAEDLRRLFTMCRDVGSICQDDIFKQLNEVQTAMKQYHVYHGESKTTEAKVKHIEEQRVKVEQQATKASKKVKSLEAQADKESSVFQENKLKTLNSRNDYLLAIEAANASLLKYHEDFNMLIDSSDFGYHNSMQRTMLTYASALECLRASEQQAYDGVNKCIQGLDRNLDRDAFRSQYSAVFVKPKRFEFQPHKGDEVCQLSAQKLVQDELIQRYQQLSKRIEGSRVENDELWKSVEEVDRHLAAVIHAKDIDVVEWFQSENPPKSPTSTENKKRRTEMEVYYFQKLQELLMSNNLLTRVQARYGLLKKALGETGELPKGGTVRLTGNSRPPSLPPKPIKARVVGKMPLVGQPKVFGCSLEEYIQVTGEDIPLVVRSCIRAINLYGMHHEGIFRVSGLQAEVNDMKSNFEKGLDALTTMNDANSVNSVASVLKSFFRELREPMFPSHLFDSLVEAIRISNIQDMVARLAELVRTLSRPRVVVARYLFAFLNHLSEYSDENLMYAYNLAICFGPTLLPIPPEKDQVAYQSNVNDVVKFMIMHHDKIFPNDGGPVYGKVLMDAEAQDEGDGTDNEHSEGEEAVDVIEAVAVYDFDGRSGRELSFKKGDMLILYNRVNAEWWEGASKGREGLVPDKYITVRRSEDYAAHHASVSSLTDATASPAGGSSTLDSLTRRIGTSGASLSGSSQQPAAAAASAATTPSREASVSSKSSSQLSLHLQPQAGAPLAERPVSPRPAATAVDLESPPAADAMPQSGVHFRLPEGSGSGGTLTESTTSSLDDEQMSADVDSIMAEVVSDLQALAASGSGASQQELQQLQPPTGPTAAAVPSGSTSLGPFDGQRLLSASVAGSLPADDVTSGGSSGSRSAAASKANSLPRTLFSAGGGSGLPAAKAVPSPPSIVPGAAAVPYMTDEPGRNLMSFRRGGSTKDGPQMQTTAAAPSASSVRDLQQPPLSVPAWASSSQMAGSGKLRSSPAAGDSSTLPAMASTSKSRFSGESSSGGAANTAAAPSEANGGKAAPQIGLSVSITLPSGEHGAGALATADPLPEAASPASVEGASASLQSEVNRKMPPPIPVKGKPSAASVAAALKQQQVPGAGTKKVDNSTLL